MFDGLRTNLMTSSFVLPSQIEMSVRLTTAGVNTRARTPSVLSCVVAAQGTD